MPIHNFVLPDGSIREYMFLHGEEIVDEKDFGGQRGKRIPSSPFFRFAGEPPSGGTRLRNRLSPDDGSVIEPGRRKDVERRRIELEEKREKKRKEIIWDQVRQLDVPAEY